VASLSQGRTAAAQCGLFTYKSVPVIFEPPCITRHVTEGITKMQVEGTGRRGRRCTQILDDLKEKRKSNPYKGLDRP